MRSPTLGEVVLTLTLGVTAWGSWAGWRSAGTAQAVALDAQASAKRAEERAEANTRALQSMALSIDSIRRQNQSEAEKRNVEEQVTRGYAFAFNSDILLGSIHNGKVIDLEADNKSGREFAYDIRIYSDGFCVNHIGNKGSYRCNLVYSTTSGERIVKGPGETVYLPFEILFYKKPASTAKILIFNEEKLIRQFNFIYRASEGRYYLKR